MCRKAPIYPKCSINISYYFHLWTWRLSQHFPASVLVLKELVLPDLLKNTTKEKTDFSILTDIYFPPGLPWVHACSPRPSAIPIMLQTPTRNLPFISSCVELLSGGFTYSSSAPIDIPHGSDSRFYAAIKRHAHRFSLDCMRFLNASAMISLKVPAITLRFIYSNW